MEQAVINVEGMTCGGCVASVTKAIKRLEGVEQANVSLESKIASVIYDKDKTNEDQIKQAVRDAGYEVAAE
jgi:copper chaperone